MKFAILTKLNIGDDFRVRNIFKKTTQLKAKNSKTDT